MKVSHRSRGIHDECERKLGRWWHGAVPVPTKGFNRAAPLPWLQTSFRGSRFQRAGSPIAVKVLTTVKVCFLLFRKMKIFQQWLALVHFAMLYSTHLQRLRRQYSNRFDGINSKEKK